jgi:HEAT repeat protein
MIIAKIPTVENSIKIPLIRAVGDRQQKSATEILFATAIDEDQKVRSESYKALALIAVPENLAATIDLLTNSTQEADRSQLEKAITTIAKKIPDNNQQADLVINKLATITKVPVRCSLLQIMGNLDDRDVLPILRQSLTSKNNDEKLAAIQALSNWVDPDVCQNLLEVVQLTKDDTQQILALRGYISQIGLLKNLTANEEVNMYNTAMTYAKNVNERRLVLAGLSKVESLSALMLAQRYLNNELRPEAEAAIIEIAGKIVKTYPDQVQALVKKIADTTQNNELRGMANFILNQLAKE